MQPFQCDLQPQIQETNRIRTQEHREQPLVAEHRGGTAAHTRYLSSPAAATLHETQGFVLRLPPHNTEHATFMQPLQCIFQHFLHHHFPSSPPPFPSSSLPLVTTSFPHHFPLSPLPLVTTSLHHHFPSSPLPFVTTSLPHHFPSSPLPLVTISQGHHTPVLTTSQSHHTPFVTTSQNHHTPFVSTSLPHHFPKSPLPFVTTSLRHHFPSSPLPFVTTSLRHHFPRSPLRFVTISLGHHCPSSPPCVITYYSFVMYCYVMSSLTPPFINVKSHSSICPQHGSIASQLPLIIYII